MATQNFYELVYDCGKWYVKNGSSVKYDKLNGYGELIKQWWAHPSKRPKGIQIGFCVPPKEFGEAVKRSERLEKLVTFKKAGGLR